MEQSQFENRLSKVDALNEGRLKKAIKVMSRSSRLLLDIVPIMLNYNDPRLPGYTSTQVPFGIDCFKPNEFQKEYLIEHGVDPSVSVKGQYSIYALYAMGSTSSIAQSLESDIDIWVCVSKDIPALQLAALSKKCNFISQYAKALGADVNLFVTPEDRFISGEHGTMDTEDCGSAQSLFLLDEFYRSSIRICGRKIAWFLISRQEENEDYQHYLEDFYQSPFINRKEWFDFGSVAKCSPVEYFGSGLWLVYKGIDHPLKAVLKILLMEAYAAEYPHTKLLSIELKANIYERKNYLLGLDSYYLMIKKVEKYLLSIRDYNRLHLAKICFYLKLKKSCLQASKSIYLYKSEVFLRRLCKVWGWKPAFISSLDNINRWKTLDIKRAQNSLIESLLESYKALIRFSVLHNIEYAITSEDAGILSRKIYSAIDEYPGKIVSIKQEFSQSLQEKYISFVQSSKDSICRKGWHIFAAPIDSLDILSTKAFYIAKTAVEAVTWLTINQILNNRTKLSVYSKELAFDVKKIKYLSNDIAGFFKLDEVKVGQLELQKPREIVKALVVLNFEKDATRDFLITTSDLEIGSSLSCGRQKMCLIGSVQMLTLNSWGEINCYSYPQGESGLLEFLALVVQPQFLKNNKENSSILDKLKICSYSQTHRALIRYDIEAVIRGIISCYGKYENNYIFSVGSNNYEARSDEHNAIVIKKNSLFRSKDEDAQIMSKFGMRPEYALQVPQIIQNIATIGVIQYFFDKNESNWDIYIVNERNEVKIFSGFEGSRSKLVNAINRYYTQESDGNKQQSLTFNLPQYFVLGNNQQTVRPFTI